MRHHHPRSPVVTAVDIGGTHVSAAIIDAQLRITGERRLPLDADAPAHQVLDQIARCVRGKQLHTSRIAIAVPGPFDYASGIGDFYGVDKFASLRDVDVRGELAARWDRAPDTLRFVNDAEAFGLGEWAAGAGERARRCVTLTLGTGIGSAFIAHGSCITNGDEVPEAGNLHTARLEGTPLEELVSRRALRRAFRERTGQRADVAEIAALARAGQRDAAEVLVAGMEALAKALAPWLCAFGAERLVIGGSMAASADLLFPPLHARLAALMASAPPALRGTLEAERANLIGAFLGTSTR